MGDPETRDAFGWPAVAREFVAHFSRAEASLKASGHLRSKKVAEADWDKLADTLGEKFLIYIRQAGAADILLEEPPRQRMTNGFRYEPPQPAPIQNARELFSRGVCRVRNNLLHGEKYLVDGTGWDRDDLLVTQASFVLDKAIVEARSIGFIK